MEGIKSFFRRNSHNAFFKVLAGFGRSVNRFYENQNHNIKSNGELTVLEKLAKFSPEIIIDGGANIGNYAKEVNRIIPGCKIFSFEPVESTFQKLVGNTSDIPEIVPVNLGLYKENCSQEINLYNSDTHSSLVDIQGLSYERTGKQIIRLTRGDDFLASFNLKSIDLLKIDIEGAEYDALLGFSESIKKGIIKAVQFEYGYINITSKKLLIDFYNFFETNGYCLGKIFPRVVEFRPYRFKYEDFLGPNFIAVKKTETELIEALKRK
jgi:FkbM family methyltransferase